MTSTFAKFPIGERLTVTCHANLESNCVKIRETKPNGAELATIWFKMIEWRNLVSCLPFADEELTYLQTKLSQGDGVQPVAGAFEPRFKIFSERWALVVSIFHDEAGRVFPRVAIREFAFVDGNDGKGRRPKFAGNPVVPWKSEMGVNGVAMIMTPEDFRALRFASSNVTSALRRNSTRCLTIGNHESRERVSRSLADVVDAFCKGSGFGERLNLSVINSDDSTLTSLVAASGGENLGEIAFVPGGGEETDESPLEKKPPKKKKNGGALRDRTPLASNILRLFRRAFFFFRFWRERQDAPGTAAGAAGGDGETARRERRGRH